MPNEVWEHYLTQSTLSCADKSSIVESVNENDSSRFTDSDADTISTPAPIPLDSSSVFKSVGCL